MDILEFNRKITFLTDQIEDLKDQISYYNITTENISDSKRESKIKECTSLIGFISRDITNIRKNYRFS